MTSPQHSPGPRDGLDEGSLVQLAQDGREIEIDIEAVTERGRPAGASPASPIDVPDNAPALIDGLPAYGV